MGNKKSKESSLAIKNNKCSICFEVHDKIYQLCDYKEGCCLECLKMLERASGSVENIKCLSCRKILTEKYLNNIKKLLLDYEREQNNIITKTKTKKILTSTDKKNKCYVCKVNNHFFGMAYLADCCNIYVCYKCILKKSNINYENNEKCKIDCYKCKSTQPNLHIKFTISTESSSIYAYSQWNERTIEFISPSISQLNQYVDYYINLMNS